MSDRRERFSGPRFSLTKDVLSVRTERRSVEDGRSGVVCTIHFTLGSYDRFITFLLVSPPSAPLFLDRAEGGGSIPGRVVGLLRDHAKQKIQLFLKTEQ